MTKTYKTEAIIVKRINLGEADRIVTAFSRDFGKVRFVAKGVRRIKSKFAGSIEPFYKSELLIVTGKNLDILSNAEIKETYLDSKPTLDELKTANLIGEIIDSVVPDNEPDEELFKIIENSLRILHQPALAKIYFEAQFYRHSGVFPHIDRCVRCQSEEISHFSTHANGALCPICRRHFADSVHVKAEALIFWKELSNNDISNVRMPMDSTFKETFQLSDRYLKTMTNHKFKSALI